MTEIVGSVAVELLLSREKFDRSIADLQRMGDLSFKITPVVDHKPLEELNRHLDRKRQHFAELNRYFQSTPLTVRVNDTALVRLNQQLSQLKTRQEITVDVKGDLSRLRSQINGFKGEVEAAFNQGATVQLDTSKLEDELSRTIERAFRRASGGGIGGVISGILKAPFALAAGAFGGIGSSISSGILFGLSEQLTKDLSKGVSNSINQAASANFGSSELLGEFIGNSVLKGFQKSLNVSGLSKVVASAQQGVSQQLQQEFGPRFFVESRANTAQARQVQSSRQQLAQKEFERENQQLVSQLPQIKDVAARAERRREVLAPAIQDFNRRIAEVRQKALEDAARINFNLSNEEVANILNQRRQQLLALAKELESQGKGKEAFGIRQSVANIPTRTADSITEGERRQFNIEFTAQGQSRLINERLAPFQGERAALQRQLSLLNREQSQVARFEQRLNTAQVGLDAIRQASKPESQKLLEQIVSAKKEIDSITAQIQRAIAASDDATAKALLQQRQKMQADKAKLERSLQLFQAASPDQKQAKQPQRDIPTAYEALAMDVAQLSETKLKKQDIPGIVVNPNLSPNTQAEYQKSSNTIAVRTAEDKAKIEAGMLSAELAEIIVHEMRHAIQFGFGKRGSADIDMGMLLSPTAEEQKRLAARIEASTGGRSAKAEPIARALEADAYTFADRFGGEIQSRATNRAARNQFEAAVGLGGGKVQLQLQQAKDRVFAQLSPIVQELPVDVSQDLEQFFNRINKIDDLLEPYLEKARNLEILPAAEIEKLQRSLQGALDVGLQKISQLTDGFAEELQAKPEQVRNDINQSLQQFNRKKVLAPLAQELGVSTVDEQGRELGKRQLINRLTSDADLRQLQSRTNDLTRARAQQQIARQEQLQGVAEGAGRVARVGIQAGQQIASTTGNLLSGAIQSEAGQAILGAATGTARGLVLAGQASFKLASGLESVALDLIPAGRLLKAGLQQTAVPAGLFLGASALLPGGGALASGLTSGVAGLLGPAGSALAGAASGQAASALSVLPNALGIQGAVTAAVTGAIESGITGAIPAIAAGATAIFGGKVIQTGIGRTIDSAAQGVGLPSLPANLKGLPAAKEQPQRNLLQLPFAPTNQPESITVDVGAEVLTPQKFDVAKANRQEQKQAEKAERERLKREAASRSVQRELTIDIGTEGKPDLASLESKSLDISKKVEAGLQKIYARFNRALAQGNKAGIEEAAAGLKDYTTAAQQTIDTLLSNLREAGASGSVRSVIGGIKGRINARAIDAESTLSAGQQIDEETLKSVGDISQSIKNLASNLKAIAKGGQSVKSDPVTKERLAELEASLDELDIATDRRIENRIDDIDLAKSKIGPRTAQRQSRELEAQLNRNLNAPEIRPEDITPVRTPSLFRRIGERIQGTITDARLAIAPDASRSDLLKPIPTLGQVDRTLLTRSKAQQERVRKELESGALPPSLRNLPDLDQLVNAGVQRAEQQELEKQFQRAETEAGKTEQQLIERRKRRFQRIREILFDIPGFFQGRAENAPISKARTLLEGGEGLATQIQKRIEESPENRQRTQQGLRPVVSPAQQAAIGQFQSGLSGVAGAVETFNADKTKENLEAVRASVREVEGSLKTLGIPPGFPPLLDAFDKFGGKASFLSKAVIGLGAAFIGFQGLQFITQQIQQFATQSIQAAISLDRLKTGLNFAVGGSAQGTRDLAFVRDTVDKLGIPLDAAQKGFVQLAAATKGTAVSGDATRSVFEGVSKAATVLGLSAEDAQGVFLAISQIASKGKVSAEEIRQQLGERLPGAFSIAARSIGVTEAEFNKLLETGSVLSDDFLPKFGEELNRTFSGSAEGASKNLQSSFFRLGAAIQKIQEGFGQAISPAVQTAVDGLTAAFTGLAVVIGPLIGIVAKFGLAFLSLQVGPPIITAISASLAGLSISASGVVGALGKAAIALKGLLVSSGPLILTFVAIEAAFKTFEAFQPTEAENKWKSFSSSTVKGLNDIAEAADKTAGKLGKIKPPVASNKLADQPDIPVFSLNFIDDLARIQRETKSIGKEGDAAISGASQLRDQLRRGIVKGTDGTEVDTRQNLQEVAGLEAELTRRRNQQALLGASKNPDDKARFEAGKEDIRNLEKQLADRRAGFAAQQAEAENGIRRAKEEIEDAKKAREDKIAKGLPTSTEDTRIQKAQEFLNIQEENKRLIDEFNKGTRTSIGIAGELSAKFAEVSANVALAKERAQFFGDRQLLQTRGTDTLAAQRANVTRTATQRAAAESGVRELQTLFNTSAAQVELGGIQDPTKPNAQGLTLNTDRAVLERALKNLPDNAQNASRRTVLQNLIQLRQLQEQLPGLQLQEADAQQALATGQLDESAQRRSLQLRKDDSQSNIDLRRRQRLFGLRDTDVAVSQAQIALRGAEGNIEATQTALTDLEGQRDILGYAEYTKRRMELEGQLADFKKQKAEQELALQDTIAKRALDNLDRQTQKVQDSIQRGEANQIVGLRRRQLRENLNPEDVAVEEQRIGLQSTDKRLAAEQAALEKLAQLRATGALNQQQFEERERVALNNLSDLKKQKAEQELALQNAINQRIIDNLQRANQLAEATIKATSTSRITDIKRFGLLPGAGELTDQAIGRASGAAEDEAIGRTIALRQKELEDNRRLFAERRINQKTFQDTEIRLNQEVLDLNQQRVDKSAQLERQLRDARIRYLDESKKAAENSINREIELLKARNELNQARSQAGIAGAERRLGETDRALGLVQRLRDPNTDPAVAAEISRQTGGASEQQILERKFALENEIAARKEAASKTEYENQLRILDLEFKKNQLAAERQQIEAKRAQIDAELGQFVAQDTLLKAQASGDPRQIEIAQKGVEIADKTKAIADIGVVQADENIKQAQQLYDIQKETLNVKRQQTVEDEQQAAIARGQSQSLTRVETGAAQRNAGLSIAGFADGGIAPGGQWAVVGERGPELAFFNQPTHITPAEITRTILADVKGFDPSKAQVAASVTPNVSLAGFSTDMAFHLMKLAAAAERMGDAQWNQSNSFTVVAERENALEEVLKLQRGIMQNRYR